MSELISMIAQQLGSGGISQIAQQLGADQQQTGSAIQAALPMIVGALANNAQQPQGAQALNQALENDHDGGILDNLGNFLGTGDTAPGAAILGHVLGARQQTAQQGLQKVSGLDAGQAGNLMAILAPVVMGALGKQRQQQQQNGFDAGALTQMLGGQQQQMQQDPMMAAATAFLDSDGDGSILDDLASKVGGGLLGSLLGK